MANNRKITYQDMSNAASIEQIKLKLRIEKLQLDEELAEAQETYFDRLSQLYTEIEQLGFNPSILD